MTVVMYRPQQRGRRGQIIDTRKPESGTVLTGHMGEARCLARKFDGFRSLSLLVESKVNLSSC